MKALIKDNFIVADGATRIEFGIYDEPFQKWALFNDSGQIILYVVDNGYSVVDYNEADKPEDFVPDKYMYINGEFILNPDWVTPPPTIEEQLAQNTAAIEDIRLTSNRITGEWNPDIKYYVGTYVSYGRKLYKCLIQNINTPVTDTIFWLETDIATELNHLLSIINNMNNN